MERMNSESKIKADFVRHGKPEYLQEEITSGKVEGSLTEEGKNDLREAISKLAETISKEELVVVVSSPKKRAVESAEIAFDILKEKGINVFSELRKEDSLKDVEMSSEFINDLDGFQESWMEYWIQQKDLSQGTEKPEEVEKRALRVIAYLNRLAKLDNLKQKLHFILFGHEEGVRDLLEEAYEIGTKKGESPTYAEEVRLDFFDVGEKDTRIKVFYRGNEKILKFDPNTRNLKKEDG
jgi:broad specificity phosphatase PhoE